MQLVYEMLGNHSSAKETKDRQTKREESSGRKKLGEETRVSPVVS